MYKSRHLHFIRVPNFLTIYLTCISDPNLAEEIKESSDTPGPAVPSEPE